MVLIDFNTCFLGVKAGWFGDERLRFLEKNQGNNDMSGTLFQSEGLVVEGRQKINTEVEST